MTGPAQPPEREPSPFERVADYVSAAMGRPVNIVVWLVLVVAWTAMFASGLVNPAGTFLPGWFTSQGFNFPLNLITTVAELFIGFLVAAASNRSERNLNRTLAAISQQETQIGEVEEGLRADLTANTDLTRKVHDLQTQQMVLLAGIEHANAELNLIRQVLAPAAPSPVPDAPVSRETAERLHDPHRD
jgi:low affinity Fe/Cu permease